MTTPGNKPVISPATPADHEPDTVGTPEGDNEYGPGTPLAPAPEGLQTPPGNAPQPFDADRPSPDSSPETSPEKEKPTGLEKFIDEVARGEYM